MASGGVQACVPRGRKACVEEARAFEDVGLLTELVATQQAVLAPDFDLDVVLEEIVAQARRLTKADAAVVELLDGDELEYRAVAGGAEKFLGLRMSAATSLSGRSIRSGEILWCQDAGSDPRVDLEIARGDGRPLTGHRAARPPAQGGRSDQGLREPAGSLRRARACA